MQWNYKAFGSSPVIGFRSSHYLGANAHPWSPFFSARDRFRPDTLNGNTGAKGRWIYRLEQNSWSVINPKLYCQNWYNNEPDPSTWNRGLGVCPCAFTQAGKDTQQRRGRSGTLSADLQAEVNEQGNVFLPKGFNLHPNDLSVLNCLMLFCIRLFWKHFATPKTVLVSLFNPSLNINGEISTIEILFSHPSKGSHFKMPNNVLLILV